MRFAPLVTSGVALAVVLSAPSCVDGTPTYNDLWAWSGGGLKTISADMVFQATDTGAVSWDVINATGHDIRASVRATHCNGAVIRDKTACPFGEIEPCEVKAMSLTTQPSEIIPPWGDDVAGRVIVTTLRGECPVPFMPRPFEWLAGRHHWQVVLDASAANGMTGSFDPELQIDRGKGASLYLYALLFATGMGALHLVTRRLLQSL